MRIVARNSFFKFLKVGVALAFVQCSSLAVSAEEGAQTANDAYLDQVVTVLRSHVLSMRMILDHDELRYADNMVRHAEAFERAFGMVGPMEWHVAEAFTQSQKTDYAEKFNKKLFEELADDTRVAIKKIKRSAIRYGRDKKKNLMRDSINNMITSCAACHSKLPEGSVPHVWQGMQE
jgi:hypothetical protein